MESELFFPAVELEAGATVHCIQSEFNVMAF
eukprot:COSAG02_NODE_38205_length_432_cov_0.618619_1_plen_30_part_10